MCFSSPNPGHNPTPRVGPGSTSVWRVRAVWRRTPNDLLLCLPRSPRDAVVGLAIEGHTIKGMHNKWVLSK